MAAAREGDRLSNLPDSIRIHILSKLPSKQVVQTSVLSSQWVSHWKSVPASLKFESTDDEDVSGFVRSVYRELFYWSSCDKIKSFSICPSTYSGHVMDSDIYFWLHFSTYIAKVEEFSLKFCVKAFPEIVYDFPEFAYTNTVLRNLVLRNCELKPFGNVNWSNLVSLSIGDAEIKEDALEKILSGCPNLECLELDKVVGIHLLKISSVKLRKLIVTMYERLDEFYCIEIDAPYIRHLELKGSCYNEMHFQLRNVTSLVTAVLSLNVDFSGLEDSSEKVCRYLQELLRHVAHVKNLELGPWCIECLSILELKGWPVPPSSWKYLKLNAALEQLDSLGISSFLLSSSGLETWVIDCCDGKSRKLLSKYTNQDERQRRFEIYSCKCSLPHLKTIKFINFYGEQSEYMFVIPLLKCLRKNSTAIKNFDIACKFRGN
ncbi:F-box/LRR-repeat protein 25-like isoform X2 [Solanum pennellii]|uniref:F-box/LRR-repeat protein 25-like isoform X2 n=1 Tax=Solanum pennellii TaxID=28526 RepID=A0ABM1VFZ9_SOLPN|nr:F-box/LRR-repeat protein 25-like isoform X2 [Solanum pennellii]